MQSAKHKPQDVQRVVAAILEQIPDLASITHVRRRDGTLVPFAAEKVGASIAAALAAAGTDDELLLARATHQTLMRLERAFPADIAPTTDDVARIAALVLIDNNMAAAARGLLDARLPSRTGAARTVGKGVRFRRRFTAVGAHPYDGIEWETRDAVLMNEKGSMVFEQRGVEVPKSWSQTATNIVASKYFRGALGSPDRERSVRQMVDRVAMTIARWGRDGGYFATEADAETFEAELTHMLVHQFAAFNSPVWFNVGVTPRPQCSACFINSVRDDMRSILNLAVTEGMLFKGGSGTGSNLSALRSSKEHLAGSSGRASGPVSFMKGFDAFAGVIKSGGKTRRAAKMVILNADHPDIEDFITCKAREERKARLLIKEGYDGGLDGDAYASVFFQNANNSVRVTDEFMRAAVDGRDWELKAVTTGETAAVVSARQLLHDMAAAAWECGDPGIQYDTTINRWHPTPNSGRINASNPCSEYMFLDDTACNLASLNVMKFRGADGEFDAAAFAHACDVLITAQEILVGNSGYPTPAIEENSLGFRPLGIGYANLGALLMSRGLAYDSDEGRNFAAAITALLSGRSYYQSSRIAEALGAFRYYKLNEKPFLKVIGMHRDRAHEIPAAGVPEPLLAEAKRAWDDAFELGLSHGYRNAQISVIAPTGTIGFLMDCATTGVEPDIALVKYKWLVGGGLMKLVNDTVPEALARLGYTEAERTAILEHIDRMETIEGTPHLKEAHLPVFDCAFRPAKGSRSIHYLGHLRMMAAVQPFVSGAISKTVNLPSEATIADVEQVYMEGWKLGLKAIAVYRDGSKGQQVVTTSPEMNQEKLRKDAVAERAKVAAAPAPAPAVEPQVRIEYKPLRRRLTDERRSLTHKFSIAGHEGYITVGLYDDGQPGELFIRMAKGGSVVNGLMDSFATSTSIALQYGVPLKVLVNKFSHVRFEPSGFTSHPNIRIAKSLVDYIFRWLALKFLTPEEQRQVGLNLDAATLAEAAESDVRASALAPDVEAAASSPALAQLDLGAAAQAAAAGAAGANALTMTFDASSDAPPCDTCGAMMIRSAACYKCLNCGNTTGCS